MPRDAKLYSDPSFDSLPKRYPARYEGEIVWVSDSDSNVMRMDGTIVPGLSINVKTGIATIVEPPCPSLPV